MRSGIKIEEDVIGSGEEVAREKIAVISLRMFCKRSPAGSGKIVEKSASFPLSRGSKNAFFIPRFP